ncbi:MAG: hypothetical protein KatS3mg097_161 [Candidatus Parcubacteria bacterium]|nr:MAG: hypothetical protein KatS3mg097_161 [Candidatus Parcubacteria bacterium]
MLICYLIWFISFYKGPIAYFTLKISNLFFRKKFILALVLLLNFYYVFFAIAATIDASAYDNQDNFIDANTSKETTENDNDDFLNTNNINPEELKKVVLNLNKNLKNDISSQGQNKNITKKFVYKVKQGDNLWRISQMFKVPVEVILQANNLTEKSIVKVGDSLVIPSARSVALLPSKPPVKKLAGKYVAALTNAGDILIPVSGLNWGTKHGNNASDIAAPCGTEVYAAKKGTVIETGEGWNGGYGNYILIKHNSNFYTLYAHLQLIVVEDGQQVQGGELIGYVGNTGYTIGNPGCNLHFEVRGKMNPLLQ